MTIYVVRHAKAGSRHRWTGDDLARPLSPPGLAQAEAIATLLGERPVARIVSSRARRCAQTVDPLADRLGLPVELDDRLLEGEPLSGALDLLDEVTGTDAVLCSHGDLIPELIDALARRGTDVSEPAGFAKGSIWVLETAHGRVATARHVPDPVAAAASVNGHRPRARR